MSMSSRTEKFRHSPIFTRHSLKYVKNVHDLQWMLHAADNGPLCHERGVIFMIFTFHDLQWMLHAADNGPFCHERGVIFMIFTFNHFQRTNTCIGKK